MEIQQTLMIIKPDATTRGRVGEIITRLERKGLRPLGFKMVLPSRELAEEHYAPIAETDVFVGAVDYLLSGPLVVMVWEGLGAIRACRLLIGNLGAPGTIRGDFSPSRVINTVHGSDDEEAAAREIALWFEPSEYLSPYSG